MGKRRSGITGRWLFAAGVFLLVLLGIVWFLLLGTNGFSSFLMQNVYIGAAGLQPDCSAELSAEKEQKYTFVSFEALRDLSIYTESDREAELKISLFNTDTRTRRKTVISIPEGKALTVIFDGVVTEDGRTTYDLQIRCLTSDAVVRVASRNGGTALYATGGPRFAAVLYWGLGIFCTAVLLIWLTLIQTGAPVHRIFLAVALPLCLIFSMLFYPGTVCDENDHYIQAYRISNRILGEKTKTIREEDRTIIDYRWAIPNLEGIYLSVYQLGRSAGAEEMVKTDHQGHAGNSVVYLLPAAGITVGRLLGRNAFTTYYLARGMNILLYLLLGWLSLRIAEKGKTFLLMWTLMPLMVNQCISVNQDCFCFSVSLLATAFWTMLNGKLSAGEKLRRKDWAGLLIILLLLACCKAYILLLMMYAVLPWSTAYGTLSGETRKWVIAGLAGAAAVSGVFLYLSGYGAKLIYAVWGREGYSRYSLRYLLQDPAEGWNVFARTVSEDWVAWIRDLFGTRLSWQTNLPMIFSAVFATVLIGSALIGNEDETQPTSAQRWMNLLMQAGLFFAVFLQACSWTSLSDPSIWGIQGRYFIPSFPFWFLLVHGIGGLSGRDKKQRVILSVFLVTLVLLIGELFVSHYLAFLVE